MSEHYESQDGRDGSGGPAGGAGTGQVRRGADGRRRDRVFVEGRGLPRHLDEYMRYATEAGEVSLRTEPGMLTMYALGEKEDPCRITLVETCASRAAYEKHVTSEHFRKYKQETLHMVKPLVLSDQPPLNPDR